jgi:hypothetical protein
MVLFWIPHLHFFMVGFAPLSSLLVDEPFVAYLLKHEYKPLLLSFSSMPDSCEDSVYLAELAKQAERYEEMVENMKRVASSVQECYLLSAMKRWSKI